MSERATVSIRLLKSIDSLRCFPKALTARGRAKRPSGVPIWHGSDNHTHDRPHSEVRATEGAMMSNSETMRVHVDPRKCQGHNRCKLAAPDLFVLDEYGNAREAGDGVVPDAMMAAAKL